MPLFAASDYAIASQVGAVTGIVVLVVLAIALVRFVLKRNPSGALVSQPLISRSEEIPPTASVQHAQGSPSPASTTLAARLPTRNLMTAIIVAVACAGLILLAVPH